MFVATKWRSSNSSHQGQDLFWILRNYCGRPARPKRSWHQTLWLTLTLLLDAMQAWPGKKIQKELNHSENSNTRVAETGQAHTKEAKSNWCSVHTISSKLNLKVKYGIFLFNTTWNSSSSCFCSRKGQTIPHLRCIWKHVYLGRLHHISQIRLTFGNG